jgi:catechol 2,3-dioxygenase-like lactoylglutathione lyase family enzyme
MLLNFSQIKETCLYIQDIEASQKFYQGLLGLEVIGKADGRHIFFRAGTSVLLCFIAENSKRKTSPPAHYAKGKQHFAFEVSTADYEKTKQHIGSMGIEIIDVLIWKNGRESFYFNDPDGHVLEVVPNGVWV